MKTLKYRIMMLLLIAALQAAGQTYVIDRVCSGVQRHYRIDGDAGSRYLWQLTDSLGNPVSLTNQAGISFSTTDPITGQAKVGSEIIISWNNPGAYKLAAVQYSPLGCDTLQQGEVRVFAQPTVFAGNPFAICIGSTATLTQSTVAGYSSLLWSSSGDGSFDTKSSLHPTYTPGPNDQSSGSVTLTITAQGNGSSNACTPAINSVNITINAKVIPTFNQIGPFFLNDTPPALPTSSTNSPAITGSWSPATISISVKGTTIYTFTPDAGQCALVTTMNIVVATQIIPTFAKIGPFCQNTPPPQLPTISTNTPPITGTWNPATINTSTVGTQTYTFTPDPTQGATVISLNVVIAAPITPVFTPIGLLYENSTPPILPTASNNVPPVTGSWTPAVISTAKVKVTTFTFTPDSSQCALKSSLVIQVIEDLTPTFNPMGPFCQNSVALALPVSSNEGVTGTWNPSTISTGNVGTSAYTFTPDMGQGATTVRVNITISAQVTPTFVPIGPLCQNSTAPALPLTSANGITGTWLPTTIGTEAVGTTTFTFTPTSGQCASVVTLDITITNSITPTFAAIGPLCQNSAAPTLPTSSTNTPAITGTWLPTTINTAAVGTTTFTFTPDAGQCAVAVTMDITITSSITPTFAPIGPLCQNSTAPTLSTSSTNTPAITGTWSPATINTAAVGTTTFTFTPDAGQCAVAATIDITITNSITPTFAAIGPLCQNSTAPTLSTSSTNTPAITGTW